MQIKSTLKNHLGELFDYTYYEDCNPNDDLDGKVLSAVHAYSFYKGKFVVVYADDKKYWTPPGGGIEAGETYEEAVIREVKEESNMKVLHQELIGFIDIHEGNKIVRHTRSFCIVEPYDDFISDPDGDITKIELINPALYKQYFDWGIVGDHIMERAHAMEKEYYILH